ncbi:MULTISPECIES: hypothetical protein [Cyanophyceae]|uniref:Uncharacterized protein n=1 Tax=Leptolyngbya subtilissima DQ-A4 TaxID=2933933 RepID=A0ABV0K863_9CYAN|nr:hypothetical protein [Nodosilinea sp. FACHB-141]MBD2114797.1 hypothetical protein [Nodosilinea sp. FACHB-141]
MASSPTFSAQTELLTGGDRVQTSLRRLATAAAAVVGLSAMAGGASGSTPAIPNGTYLYGESPVADTVGAIYFVFEAQEGRLNGAIYQPSSSFDCVRGTVGNAALDLVITNAYDQSESSYSVAMVADTAVASSSGGAGVTELEGLHAIATLSELDQQLLATCANR